MLNEQPFSKTQFTMLVGDVENRLEILRRQRPVDTIVLVGIETHVCIIATCIDLIHRGLNVSIYMYFWFRNYIFKRILQK